MARSVIYMRVESGAMPEDITAFSPFRAVVIIEADVSNEWQFLISDWLVRSGCSYMLAWGVNCSSWDDSVDMANIEQFDFSEIPEDKFVMTTWHDDQPLAEVFRFSKNHAVHPAVELEHTVLLHISAQNKERELLQEYDEA